MKFGRAKMGEKFVFFHKGGVWEKTGPDAAKMMFGEDPGRPTCGISNDMEVYVFFERDERKAQAADAPMKIRVIDRTTEQDLLVIPDATAQQVAAYSYSETFRYTPAGKRKEREYSVDDVILCHNEQTLVLVVRDVTEMNGQGVTDVD